MLNWGGYYLGHGEKGRVREMVHKVGRKTEETELRTEEQSKGEKRSWEGKGRE